MSYYDTIDDDVKRAKEILAKSASQRTMMSPAMANAEVRAAALAGGTIYGGDNYVAYKLLESFVQYIETHFRPDHNGECLNCDEPEDGHGFVAEIKRLRAEIEQLQTALNLQK